MYSGDFPVTSWPDSVKRPRVGLVNPLIRLNVVLLPAPLGPIRPRISFRRTSKSRSDTATRPPKTRVRPRSEEHTSELQSLMRNSYAVFCLKKKKTKTYTHYDSTPNKST